MRLPGALCLAFAVSALVPVAWGAPPRARLGAERIAQPLGTVRSLTVDAGRHIDINLVDMPVTNVGPFGWDLDARSLVYPKGSGRTALFAAGLWVGGRVGGEPRVTVADYASEYGPGAMVGNAADDPARPAYRVYKVARWTGSPTDSAHVERTAAERAADPQLDSLAHHSWSEYMAGAAPHGAPWRLYRLPNTATADPSDSVDVPGPDVLGDQMLWCVFNDADPALHTYYGDASAPLGIEVRQTVFAYDRPGPLGSTVFLRYQLRNRSNDTIAEMRTSVFGDFDIGGTHDDLAGCMESRSLGYMYNSRNADYVYGPAAPALGFDLLAEHYSPILGRNTGMDSFIRYVDDSAQPGSGVEAFNAMLGLQHDGTPIVDPTSGQATTFMVTGDPVSGSGWLDGPSSDRRILCTSGPWTLAPGDSLTLWVALVIGQADTPTGSVAALGCADDYIQSVFDAGFTEPFLAPPVCFLPPVNCPRSSNWWAEQCAAGGGFSAPEWLAIARWADSTSAVFAFADPQSSAEHCSILSGPWPTARDSAKREYLALLSNVAAGELGLIPGDGAPVRLSRGTELLVPPLLPTLVAQLIQDRPDSIRLMDARYENRVLDHPRAYDGVNVGLPFFSGGAGTGWDFFGGTLDSSSIPDSFATVELRFSGTATQRAYRFFRLEQAGGSAPAIGRGYHYGGFRTVNLQAWDVAHNQQLDIAFVERMVTDADGTYLPPAQQPASQDSTWSPTAEPLGGREYLFVLRRPYSDTPKPSITIDGALANNTLPLLYTLWARLRDASAVVDDGDLFRFVFGYPPTVSAERLLDWLEPLALSDTLVAGQYRAFAAGVADVNRGLGIGAVCGDPTPVAGALIEARTDQGYVTLRWLLNMPATAARLEVRNEWGVWLDWGPAQVEGRIVTATGFFYDDGSGRQWYRLAIAAPIGLARTDSVSITTAFPTALSLVGVWPNPSVDGRPRVEFVLPEAGTVRIEVYDLTGRRVAEREAGMDAGTQFIEIAPGSRLRAGVYFVRLRFGSEQRTARLVVVN